MANAKKKTVDLTVGKAAFDKALYPITANHQPASNGVLGIVIRILTKFEAKSTMIPGKVHDQPLFQLNGDVATFTLEKSEADILNGIVSESFKALPAGLGRLLIDVQSQLETGLKAAGD